MIIGFLFRRVDPSGDGQLGWVRCIALEAVRVSAESGIEGSLALAE